MAKKEYAPRYKTPEGTARYPWLNIPDEYKGKKSWKVDLVLDSDSPECLALIEQMDKVNEQAFESETASLKKRDRDKATPYEPYFEEYDDQEELTGKTIFKFKRTAEFTDKKTGEPRPIHLNYYDAQGKWVKTADLEERIGKIGSGSKIQIEYEPFAFYNASSKQAGATMRLVGVKVNTLVVAGGGGAQDWDGSTPEPEDQGEPDF